MSRLFNFFRGRKPDAKGVKMFPRTYQVKVCIDHPLIAGHCAIVMVGIDAHSKEHAREQLREQLKITIGAAHQVKQ